MPSKLFRAVIFTPIFLMTIAASATTVGGFVAVRPIPVEGFVQSTAIADLNHDGYPDMVVSAGTKTTRDSSGNYLSTPEGVAVLLGNGNRTFQTPVHYAT